VANRLSEADNYPQFTIAEDNLPEYLMINTRYSVWITIDSIGEEPFDLLAILFSYQRIGQNRDGWLKPQIL